MKSLHLQCPAATPIEPPGHGPSVVCGVLDKANDGAHVGGFTARGQVSALMSGKRDPSVVEHACCGDYTACLIWRAQRDAERATRRGPDALRDVDADRAPAGRPGTQQTIAGLVAQQKAQAA